MNQLNAQKNLESWKKNKRTEPFQLRLNGDLKVEGDNSFKATKLLRLSKLENLQDTPGPTDSQALPTETTATEEDFVNVTYRALSAAMLADRPIDFSKGNVLKKATPLLVGQTVFKDHITSVDNWVGRVVDTFWDTKTEGFPPGINAIMQLDMVKDPMAVRGVLQGALHSASVTVSFTWVPSHPALMEDGSFFNKLGEEVDGEMVRLVVDQIEKFWEISLVWQGADQYAKQIDDNGTPVLDPNLSAYNHSGQILEGEVQHLSVSTFTGNNRKENEMDKLKEILAALGVQVKDNATQEDVINQFKALKDGEKQAKEELLISQTSLKTAQEDLAKEQKKSADLEVKVAELTPQAELGKQYLEDERKEAVRLYKLSKDEKEVNAVILKTLEKSDLEVVQAWKAEFKKDAEEKFPSKCQSCGSHNIERKSSKAAPLSSTEPSTPKYSPDVAENIRNLHS